MSEQKTAPVYDPILKASSLFRDLSELELNAVVAFLEPRKIKSGELIFSEGAAGEEMFFLVSGEISAWVKQADGTKRMMFEIKPGDFFGEMSIIVNESRSATLIAKGDIELFVLHGIDFYRIIYELPMIGIKMLKAIGMVQNSWLEQTSRHLGDLMRWGEAARRRAISDELTGLYNRRFLEESANERFEKSSVGLRNLSLMMMDLDHLHEINNNYGPKAGDLVFIAMADILRTSIRTGDICARLSGDEFSVLLPDTGHDEAFEIAEKIRQNTASRKFVVPDRPDGTEQIEISVFTSIGIASAPAHADCWEKLFTAADSALRRAKELGRNRVQIAEIPGSEAKAAETPGAETQETLSPVPEPQRDWRNGIFRK